MAGSDLQPSSLSVGVTLNRSARPASGASSYLALLGLAIPTDATLFDRDNRLFPRPRDPTATQTLRESYIVFPTLRPFSDTPGLSPTERSDSLYRTPQYLLLSQGPPSRFQLQLQYNAAAGGDRSTLVLNALQVKENSDELSVSGRLLTRGVDYSIDYATGRVTFLNPDALFGAGTAVVSARFEQQDAFAVAPTSILGFTSRYSLGERGAVNFIGMLQREADRVQPAASRLRGQGQPDRRRQHRAALQADVAHARRSTRSPARPRPPPRCSISMPSWRSRSRIRTGPGPRISRSSRATRARRSRSGSRAGSSAASLSAPTASRTSSVSASI